MLLSFLAILRLDKNELRVCNSVQNYALGYKPAIFQLRAHFRAQKGKMEGKNEGRS